VNVTVDRGKCQGHNRCVTTCPEVFTTDELGYSVVLKHELRPELVAKVLAAEANCPEQAISVHKDSP
jgi:ferredoxin